LKLKNLPNELTSGHHIKKTKKTKRTYKQQSNTTFGGGGDAGA